MALTQVSDAGLKKPASDLQDNEKIILGTGDDLQIYHDGSNSYIQDSGTGNLILQATDFQVKGYNTGEVSIAAAENGAVELYFNNGKKAETVTGGFTISGVCTATSYAGDGSSLTGVASATADGCMYENALTISNNYTVAATKGAHSVGPITNNAVVTLNGVWVIS